MNSEKTVIDLENEVKANIVKEHQDRVTFRLRNLLDCKVSKENSIVALQAELDKVNAKIAEFEALSVEDAYALIEKENPMCSVGSGTTLSYMYMNNATGILNSNGGY